MSARARPLAKPETVLTPAEIETLDRINAARSRPRIMRRTVATYLIQTPCSAAISLARAILPQETWSSGVA